MIRSRIAGRGFHVPNRVVTNAELQKLMDTSDAWVVERTAILDRLLHHATTLNIKGESYRLDSAGGLMVRRPCPRLTTS